jgi:hypothetical protein
MPMFAASSSQMTGRRRAPVVDAVLEHIALAVGQFEFRRPALRQQRGDGLGRIAVGRAEADV